MQSDPLEKRFSRYRSMSGGRFLVGLREVLNSEKIIVIKSMLKENINIWEEDVKEDSSFDDAMDELNVHLSSLENEIMDSCLSKNSEEVAVMVAGYVAKKMLKRSNCNDCKCNLIHREGEKIEAHYISILNRGGLIIPSANLASYVCRCFSILDVVGDVILKHAPLHARSAAEKLLLYHNLCKIEFHCDIHASPGKKMVNKIITNVFFNNEQKLSNADRRKDEIKNFKMRQIQKR